MVVTSSIPTVPGSHSGLAVDSRLLVRDTRHWVSDSDVSKNCSPFSLLDYLTLRVKALLLVQRLGVAMQKLLKRPRFDK